MSRLGRSVTAGSARAHVRRTRGARLLALVTVSAMLLVGAACAPGGSPDQTPETSPSPVTPSSTTDASTSDLSDLAPSTQVTVPPHTLSSPRTSPATSEHASEQVTAGTSSEDSTSSGTPTAPSTSEEPPDVALPELPGGGRVMFPGRTLVAIYGYPGSSALGALGQQELPDAIARAKRIASGYRPLVEGPVVPTFEIIATVASAGAGADGNYSSESSVEKLRPWVEAATEAGMYVILDLQPGRANLLDQANLYIDLLRLPNVGLALDPEWKLAPGEKPLQQIGGVDAAEVNGVIRWLSRLTAAGQLPQKVLVLHQFALSMLRNEADIITDDENVAVLIHMDGQGSPAGKESTWRSVLAAAPDGVFFGWKNFFAMDRPMYTQQQTVDREPVPAMISYQ